jgi:uncharacterized protein (DUF1778 family)
MRTSSNYALRLPASLKRAIEEVAREDGTTLNQFIVSAVAEKLAALKTADYFAKRAVRADFRAFDRLMSLRRGEPPQPDDEVPENYRKKVREALNRAHDASWGAAAQTAWIDP